MSGRILALVGFSIPLVAPVGGTIPSEMSITESNLAAARIETLSRVINNEAAMLTYYHLLDQMYREILESITRMRELAVRRSSGFLDATDREIIDSEIRTNFRHVLYVLSLAELDSQTIFADPALTEAFDAPATTRFKLQEIDELLQFVLSHRSIVGSRAGILERRLRQQVGRTSGDPAPIRENFNRALEQIREEQICLVTSLLAIASEAE